MNGLMIVRPTRSRKSNEHRVAALEVGNPVTIADLPAKEAVDVHAASVSMSCTAVPKWCSRTDQADATPMNPT